MAKPGQSLGKAQTINKPSTIQQREKKGYDSANILRQTNNLLNSILADWSSSEAVASTNKIYAAAMHFGVKKGASGKTKHGSPLPWGDIPAREFLGLSSSHEKMIDNDVARYVTEPWQ